MESIKICRFKTFRVGYIDKKLSSPSLFIIYMLKIVFCITAGKFVAHALDWLAWIPRIKNSRATKMSAFLQREFDVSFCYL